MEPVAVAVRPDVLNVVNVADDPRRPRIEKVIEPNEVIEATGYTRPHTVHCMPGDNVVISMLGDADGNGSGGFAVLDARTFELKGRWENGGELPPLNYDFRYQPRKDVLGSSEFGESIHLRCMGSPCLVGLYAQFPAAVCVAAVLLSSMTWIAFSAVISAARFCTYSAIFSAAPTSTGPSPASRARRDVEVEQRVRIGADTRPQGDQLMCPRPDGDRYRLRHRAGAPEELVDPGREQLDRLVTDGLGGGDSIGEVGLGEPGLARRWQMVLDAGSAVRPRCWRRSPPAPSLLAQAA